MRSIPGTLLSICLLTAPALGQSAATPAHEETVVRQAYAKVSYLTQVKVITDAALKTYNNAVPVDQQAVQQNLEDANVVFELSDFKTGLIAEVADTKWGDLITVPPAAGQALKVDVSGLDFKDADLPSTTWSYATASWVAVPPGVTTSDPGTAQVLAMPLHTLMDMGAKLWVTPDAVWTRYANYSVVVHFKGQSIGPYRAMFFFGTSKGQEVVAAQDLLTDDQALYYVLQQPIYPTGLLRTTLRSGVAGRWLDDNKLPAGRCHPGKHEVCCVESQCGIADADLESELAAPLVHQPKKATTSHQ